MHAIYDGPLKRFLSRHLIGINPALVVPEVISISDEIKAELQLGNLQEDFEVKDIRGEPQEISVVVLGLMDKLYSLIELECHEDEMWGDTEIRPYTLHKEGKGPGILLTYTFSEHCDRLRVTVQNFDF